MVLHELLSTKMNVKKMAYKVAVKSKKNFLTIGMEQNWRVMIGYMVLRKDTLI